MASGGVDDLLATVLTGSYDSASCRRGGRIDNSQDGIVDAAASILRFDLTAEGFAAQALCARSQWTDEHRKKVLQHSQNLNFARRLNALTS